MYVHVHVHLHVYVHVCICIATVHRVMTSYDAVCRECISKILIFQMNWRECKFSKMFNSLVTRLIMCADVVCTLMTQPDVSKEQESEKKIVDKLGSYTY